MIWPTLNHPLTIIKRLKTSVKTFRLSLEGIVGGEKCIKLLESFGMVRSKKKEKIKATQTRTIQ